MRRKIFKSKPVLNWRYVLGEILLIFIGINLAIWFNNWNTNRQNIKAKKVAIEKIKEEIASNVKDLDTVYQNALLVSEAIGELKALFQGNSSQLKVSPQKIKYIREKFPGFYRIRDSTLLDDGHILYQGTTFIQLELKELKAIAWETTKTLDILNEFGYDCLYDLETLYKLQSRVQREIDKAAEALQERTLDDLIRILEFSIQLENQLAMDYERMLVKLDNCE